MKPERAGAVGARAYRQTARAESSARTRRAILDATVALAMQKAAVNMSLADVAEQAGVSVQTVLRHFGTRDTLLDAALEHGSALVAAERRVPDGDVPAAVRILFEHYEARGPAMIRLLAQEEFDERVASVTDRGRRLHREWVEHLLPVGSTLRTRVELIDQLVVVTDVYAWKLLRRDGGLDRTVAEERMRSLIAAVLAAAEGGRSR